LFKEKSPKLQEKIGLIQIATQEKVALFHIGLHPGKTTAEIIAPSLRKIIEDPAIGKIGVAVLSADFSRLSKFFGLKPKGAIELSHLHRLVVFGGWKPELVSTKMISLANLVEKHLGLPLHKGEVRTSNWSKPLSEAQINYAAGDAYAGLMLYHCMNAKRLRMKPVPPLPVHADKYQAMERGLPRISRLYLQPSEEGGEPIPSDVFFGVPTKDHDGGGSRDNDETSERTSVAQEKTSATIPTAAPAAPAAPATVTTTPTKSEKKTPDTLDEASQRLYQKLVDRRNALSVAAKVAVFKVAHNVVLERLARGRPVDTEALLKIRGIGQHLREKYGNAWIEVIKEFIAEEDGQLDRAREATPDSSPAFETPPESRPAQLHTGVSFMLAETALSEPTEDMDSSLPCLDFDGPASRRSSGQKRKRAQSPLKATDARRQSSSAFAQADEDELHDAVLQATQARIFRNKLVALSKLVGRKLASRSRRADGPPIVSDDTLDAIVSQRPRTHEELRQIGGIEQFFQACFAADVDLLKNVVKFGPAETR
jgi:ribonuclease D